MNEINRPRVIYRLRPFPHCTQVTQTFAPTPPAQGQSFFAVAPFDALVIDLKSLATNYPIQQRTAPAPPLLGQCSQPLPQFLVTAFRRKLRRVIPINPQARRCDR
jgi:hypothetical protein